MNKKLFFTSVCLVIALVLIVLTFYFSLKVGENNNIEEISPKVSEIIEDECTKEYIEKQNLESVSSSEEKVSANAILILKKYYKKCEHTINEYVELPPEIVNMTKEEVQRQYADWEVIGFETDKVTLYQEFEGECGEHFKLKIEDGKISIYIINEKGIESLYEKTNISTEYLTETDLTNMENGLEIYGKEELNKIIEDFE